MLVDDIKNLKSLELRFKDKIINIDGLKDDFFALTNHGYFAPSFVTTDQTTFNSIINDDYWLKLIFSKTEHFKEYSFDTLYIKIKPKYNWLTLYREIAGNIQSKCLNINLATKTTAFYKQLEKILKENTAN